MTITYQGWPKTPRMFRDITITEKIDGTNAAVHIKRVEGFGLDYNHVITANDGNFAIAAQSRKRLITPGDDNFGFARWVEDNAVELVAALGEGVHYGEWWGLGIQRGYGMDRKVFSLFNVHRYEAAANESNGLFSSVPVLYQGPNSTSAVNECLSDLIHGGSVAAPGFPSPEGVITYHSASRQVYKALIENDHLPKGAAA